MANAAVVPILAGDLGNLANGGAEGSSANPRRQREPEGSKDRLGGSGESLPLVRVILDQKPLDRE
jgi:hypothetical protein